MKGHESCQKRRRAFEEPKPSFESADTSSRAPDSKKPKNTLSQNYPNAFQEINRLIAERQQGTQNQRLYEMNTNLKVEVEVLKIEQKCLLRQLEESRSKLAKAELELKRKVNEQPHSTNSGLGALARKQQKTFLRYTRSESARKALVFQKKYLLGIIGGFQETEESTKSKLISKMGGQTSKDLATSSRKNPIMRFRAAVRVCIAVHRYVHVYFDEQSLKILLRLEFLRKKWQKRITRTQLSSKDVVSSSKY